MGKIKDFFSNKVVKEISEWIICFIIAYVIYLFVNFFIGTIAGIRQSSMYPTAKEGDRVIISRRIWFNKDLNKGDIVTIEAPIAVKQEGEVAYAIYPNYSGVKFFTYNVMELGKKSYIKRVIALGGDKVFISEEGRLYINDELQEENYLPEQYTPRTGSNYNFTVPEGYVFVMGDNRTGSKDGREFGVVPEEKVEGKVITRIWPLNKIGEI